MAVAAARADGLRTRAVALDADRARPVTTEVVARRIARSPPTEVALALVTAPRRRRAARGPGRSPRRDARASTIGPKCSRSGLGGGGTPSGSGSRRRRERKPSRHPRLPSNSSRTLGPGRPQHAAARSPRAAVGRKARDRREDSRRATRVGSAPAHGAPSGRRRRSTRAVSRAGGRRASPAPANSRARDHTDRTPSSRAADRGQVPAAARGHPLDLERLARGRGRASSPRARRATVQPAHAGAGAPRAARAGPAAAASSTSSPGADARRP